MKVLFLTRRFWPEIGGVEKHVLEVSKRLVEMGHEMGYEVVVIAENAKGFIRPLLVTVPSTSEECIRTPPRCFEIHRIPVGSNEKLKKFQIWWWLWENRQLIKQADIVHAHDIGFWYWPFRFLYPEKPFFITFHGWEGEFPIPLKNKIVRKISEKIAWGNICVGDYLKKWYGTKADFITYGGVDNSPRRSPFDKLRATIRGVFPIVFIGRLEKDTGLPIYLGAMESFKVSKFQSGFFGRRDFAKRGGKAGKSFRFC